MYIYKMMNSLRRIQTLGKTNKTKLLKAQGFRNINQAIEFYDGIKKKKYSDAEKRYVYEMMRDDYNEVVTFIQANNKKEILNNKKQDKITKDNIVKDKINKINEPDIAKLKAELKKYVGKSVIVEYLVNSKNKVFPSNQKFGKYGLVRTKEYTIGNNFKKFWLEHGYDWFYSYDEDLFTHYECKGRVFIYPQNDYINTTKVVQLFRDGITHCVFTPIRNWAMNKYNEAGSKQTKSRYNCLLNELETFENMYSNGVPENSIAEICNKLQIDITIDMPFSSNKLIEGQSIKKRLRLFRFMNTRLNHVDLNEIVSNDDFTVVTRDELFRIKDKLDEDNTFYTFKKDKNNIASISTLTDNYKLSNQFSEIVSKFEIDTGLNFCKIDDIDDFNLSQFIKEGTNYNSTVDFRHFSAFKKNDINHIDMRKAYANYKTCKFYSGFLGKITDFRQTDRINGVGMYRITNLVIPKGNFKDYNDKLRIYLNNNVYTSVELNMLTSYGAKYKIVSGCWGVKPIHLEFTDEMMELRDDDDIPFYSKWAGVCDQHRLEKKFWIKGEKEYFDAIRDNCDERVVRWYENGEGCIAFPKKHNFHLGHITAFITAYQRMNMIEQIMEINFDKVIRVCVDGIYHIQEQVTLKNVFRTKTEKNFGNDAGDSYVSSACERELIIKEPQAREHFSKELHIGEGGCGKTHYNCNDKGLVRVLFIAPSWKLARCKKNETGINCSVWARALSDDPEKVNAIKSFSNTLIIDEISMLSEEQKQKFFRVYSDMKIIMCGDLGYQLPCIDGNEADSNGFENTVSHNQDFRCKDVALKQIKTCLRNMIKEKRSKNFINEWVLSEFKKINKVIGIDELKAKYSIQDMILSGTNELKDYYTSFFVGKFETEKYYIMENNRVYCNGDIVIGDKPEKCKHEIRHAFTTHSIQGETAYHNLFIDSSKMFDSRMFYTAISRAKSLSQVFIIENQEQKFVYEYAKIYKIVSDKGTYIGSTIQSIEKRLAEHFKEFEKYKKNGGKFITSYNVLNDNAKISKIENFRCNDLKELWKREAEIIKQFGNKCVNKTFNEEK